MTTHDNANNAPHTLVLGAGELGMAILRHLAPRQKAAGRALAVLVTPGSIDAPTPRQRQDHATLRALDVGLVPFDLAQRSEEELVALLRPFDTVINCTGFVAGPVKTATVETTEDDAPVSKKRVSPERAAARRELANTGKASA